MNQNYHSSLLLPFLGMKMQHTTEAAKMWDLLPVLSEKI